MTIGVSQDGLGQIWSLGYRILMRIPYSKDELPSLEVLRWSQEHEGWHLHNAALVSYFGLPPHFKLSDSIGTVSASSDIVLVFLVQVSLWERGLNDFHSSVAENWLGSTWSSVSWWADARKSGEHYNQLMRPHLTHQGGQRNLKRGSHSIQNKVNEFILGLICPWIWTQDSWEWFCNPSSYCFLPLNFINLIQNKIFSFSN